MSMKRPNLKLSLTHNTDAPDPLATPGEGLRAADKMVEVYPQIFISGAKLASNIDLLRSNEIHVIISMIDTKDMKLYPNEFKYMNFPTADNVNGQQNIHTLIRTLPAQIEEERKQGRNVLVHCQEGISRAPTIVIGYLMHKTLEDYDTLVNKLREKSKKVDPNAMFQMSLVALHDDLISKKLNPFSP